MRCSRMVGWLLAALCVGWAVPSHAQLLRKSQDQRPRFGRAKGSVPAATPAGPVGRSASNLLRNGLDYLELYGDPDRALEYLKAAEERREELTEPQRYQLAEALSRAARQKAGTEIVTAPVQRRAPAPQMTTRLHTSPLRAEHAPSLANAGDSEAGDLPSLPKADLELRTVGTQAGPNSQPANAPQANSIDARDEAPPLDDRPPAASAVDIMPPGSAEPAIAPPINSTSPPATRHPAPSDDAAASPPESAQSIGLTVVSDPSDLLTIPTDATQPQPAGQTGPADAVSGAQESATRTSPEGGDVELTPSPGASTPIEAPVEPPIANFAPDAVPEDTKQPQAAEVRLRLPSAPRRAPQRLAEIDSPDERLPELPPTATEPSSVDVETPLPPAAEELIAPQPIAAPAMAVPPQLNPAPTEAPSQENGAPPSLGSEMEATSRAGDEPAPIQTTDERLPELPSSEPSAERDRGFSQLNPPPAVPGSTPSHEPFDSLPTPPSPLPQPERMSDELPPLPASESDVSTDAAAPRRLLTHAVGNDRPASPDTSTSSEGSGIEVRNPETLREIEELARLQEEGAPRLPQRPRSDPGYQDDRDRDSEAELPRAPSPAEARPISPIPVPEEYVPLEKRMFEPYRKYWAAAATCHTPLYFQDAVLERYGQSVEQALGPHWGRRLSYPLDDPRQSTQRNQLLQPAYSAGIFIVQLATWPAKLVLDPPWEAEYDLGYYRPGDPIPPDTYYWPKLGIGPPLHGRKY